MKTPCWSLCPRYCYWSVCFFITLTFLLFSLIPKRWRYHWCDKDVRNIFRWLSLIIIIVINNWYPVNSRFHEVYTFCIIIRWVQITLRQENEWWDFYHFTSTSLIPIFLYLIQGFSRFLIHRPRPKFEFGRTKSDFRKLVILYSGITYDRSCLVVTFSSIVTFYVPFIKSLSTKETGVPFSRCRDSCIFSEIRSGSIPSLPGILSPEYGCTYAYNPLFSPRINHLGYIYLPSARVLSSD